MKIVSMVAILVMEDQFDINDLLTKLPNAEKSLHWVQMRFTEKNNHIAFYPSGKIRISGVKSDEELNLLARKLIDYLKTHRVENSVNEIKVINYVLISEIDFKINLDQLILKLFEYDASYEPELFPALKFKDEHKITYLLFSSGKITITGVKSLKNLESYVNSFKELIYEKSFED